jgi:hypothetical protein
MTSVIYCDISSIRTKPVHRNSRRINQLHLLKVVLGCSLIEAIWTRISGTICDNREVCECWISSSQTLVTHGASSVIT